MLFHKFLILPCYTVYHKGKFFTEHPNSIKVYEMQLKKAFELLNRGEYDVLIISGGYTRPEIEKSEARGMLDWAEDLDLKIKGKVILEEYAKDSLENLIFSLCRYFQFFGRFPETIGCITWKFNKERFEIFARELGFPRLEVICVGEMEGQQEIAKKLAKLATQDPFYVRQPDSARKLRRDPWKKGHPYWQINENFRRFFEKWESTKAKGGRLSELREFCPWQKEKY